LLSYPFQALDSEERTFPFISLIFVFVQQARKASTFLFCSFLSWNTCSSVLEINNSSKFRPQASNEMMEYLELAAMSSYKDSLKVLEADIQHANVL
jgi:hypothetical protein